MHYLQDQKNVSNIVYSIEGANGNLDSTKYSSLNKINQYVSNECEN